MIIGNGLLASAFFDKYAKDDHIVVFASGVSNSHETNFKAYKREKDLLLHTLENLNEDKMIIYFSTCSIYDKSKFDDMYVKHKKEMEGYVSSHAKNYYIFRLPQVIGKSQNKHTLLNFFYENIKHQQTINIFSKSTRNLIDVDDVKTIVVHLTENDLYQNTIINIANEFNYTPMEIVHSFEDILGIKANVNLLDEGDRYDIDISKISSIYKYLNIHFDNYLLKKIEKYYGAR